MEGILGMALGTLERLLRGDAGCETSSGCTLLTGTLFYRHVNKILLKNIYIGHIYR